ncbi:BcsR/BcsP family cellulose biosynthesis protein [Escherichia coli]
MNNNEPDTLPDPAIGYIFQNDILALKQAFSLPDIDYADISQREQLDRGIKTLIPLLAEFAQQK